MNISVLYVTSFSADISASGFELLESFGSCRVQGHMLIAHEGVSAFPAGRSKPDWAITHDLDKDEFLRNWLVANRPYIPEHLGGTAKGCQCPNGPYGPHDKKRHRLPCVGYWFCRNASRWFRKVVALRFALQLKPEYIVWVDADCRFLKQVRVEHVKSWFQQHDVFYFKSQRPVMETGIVGYDVRPGHRGRDVIRSVQLCYTSGDYRRLIRWDDSYVTQKAIAATGVRAVDLATRVGEHGAVIEYSPVGQYIMHDKGRHGRKLGIMK